MYKSNTCVRIVFAVVFCNGIAHAATLAPETLAQPADQPQTASSANQSPEQPGAKPPSGPGWIAKCASELRKGPLECSVEETLVMANTGQFVADVAVRMRPDTHDPVMTIRIPVGLYLPAGLTMSVDDGKPQPVPLQTCDQQGVTARRR